jgi:TIR domain
MTDIFISYSSADRERARTVASALQARRWSVWWDRDIKAGQAFDQIIEHELEMAKSVVVLWSKHSITSDWVKGEAAAALQRGVLVPAFIDNVKLPLEFRRRQTVDLIDWQGDTTHAGFQALCDGIAGITGVTPGSTPATAENRQAARGSRNQTWVLKDRWKALPGLWVAAAALVAVLAAVVAVLKLLPPPNAYPTPTPPPSQSTGTTGSPAAPRSQPTSAAPTVAPSTDRDKPTWLTSNEIRGRGVGERISHYYAVNAGPGIIRAIVDGRNKSGGSANAIAIELSDIDAKPLLNISLGYTTEGKREVGRVELGRRQEVIMRVLLDEATIDYMVRLEGAVDFSPAPTHPN